MMQLRELRLTGKSKPPASVRFCQGANVFSGVSDTGKSYMFHCIDYALGADKNGARDRRSGWVRARPA
jgi:hypothetical protein